MKKKDILRRLAGGALALGIALSLCCTTALAEEPVPEEGLVAVEAIPGLPEDFIRGVDISSLIAELDSGVVYRDYDGSPIDTVEGFCELLADSGVTHVRVRVWNDPYDENGHGYGGGNNDLDKAVRLAKGCAAAGLKMLVDFHCSDLWTDPSKQQPPKAFAGMSAEEKGDAQAAFIADALAALENAAPDVVDMIQIGNETSTGFMGVWASDAGGVEAICQMANACAAAVRTVDPAIRIVFHVTNPEKGNITTWGKNLAEYEVDYDILATSYYPYWHGSLENLKSELTAFQKAYPGRQVLVAETSYAYTLEDSDGHPNTVGKGSNDSGENILQPFTVQGQATALRDLMAAVHEAGGLGVFYWEPAWITVGDTTGMTGSEFDAQLAANKARWEEFGSGWAASYAAGYDPDDAGQWYGGSAVDNEALFYPDGTPTEALPVWNYVFTGSVTDTVSLEGYEVLSACILPNEIHTLPDEIVLYYSTGTVSAPVEWQTKSVSSDTACTLTIPGTVKLPVAPTAGYEHYRGIDTIDVTYTLTVEPENLIPDAQAATFQKADGLTLEKMDIPAKGSGDETSGDAWGCAHWWNSGAETMTASVTYGTSIELQPGEYQFEAQAQGEVGDTVTAQILDEEGSLLFAGDPVTLAAWQNWKKPFVSFTLDAPQTVRLRLEVSSQPKGWGTVDLLGLYQTAIPATPSSDPVSVGVIGGADGPTAIFVSVSPLFPVLLAAVIAAAVIAVLLLKKRKKGNK